RREGTLTQSGPNQEQAVFLHFSKIKWSRPKGAKPQLPAYAPTDLPPHLSGGNNQAIRVPKPKPDPLARVTPTHGSAFTAALALMAKGAITSSWSSLPQDAPANDRAAALEDQKQNR
ncbi:hypothetical protein DBY65_026290, partial [Pseudomonas sp. RIT412]